MNHSCFKKSFYIFLLIFYFSVTAKSESLICQTIENLETKSKIAFNTETGQSYPIGEINAFRIKLNDLGQSKFELEIFKPDDPSRIYSQSFIRNQNDYLSWTYWGREILLEIRCEKQLNKSLQK